MRLYWSVEVTFILIALLNRQPFQGTIDKVILIIKDKDEVALERFIFSIEKILNIKGYNTDVG